MKIKCDICGGELVVLAGGKGASCKVCGMEHSIERVREMLNLPNEQNVAPTAPKQTSVVVKATPDTVEEVVELDCAEIEIVEEIEELNVDEIEIEEEIFDTEILSESSESDFKLKKNFLGNYELKSYSGNAQRVVFPNKWIEVSDRTLFEGHDEIVELIFPNGYTGFDLDHGIFEGLKNLRRIICDGSFHTGPRDFKGCKNLETLIIRNADTIVFAPEAFADCTKLKMVELNETAETDLGRAAFKNCRSLETFIHSKRSVYFAGEGIESSCFEGCTSLHTVVLADDTKAIHKDAFKDCNSLKNIDTHNGKMNNVAIHTQAFSNAGFKPQAIGICPKCKKELSCTQNEMNCSCGFAAIQYED